MENTKVDVELMSRVKEMIIDRLDIEMDPEEIRDDIPIFGVNENGDGLNMDSVDALELVVGMNEVFGVKHQNDDLSVLYSVKTITEYIQNRIGE